MSQQVLWLFAVHIYSFISLSANVGIPDRALIPKVNKI